MDSGAIASPKQRFEADQMIGDSASDATGFMVVRNIAAFG
jgi:hypothetical protein